MIIRFFKQCVYVRTPMCKIDIDTMYVVETVKRLFLFKKEVLLIFILMYMYV